MEASAQAAYSALTVKQAKLELIDPVEVVECATDLVDVVENFLTLVGMRASAFHELGLLPGVLPGQEASRRAHAVLEALRAASGEGTSNSNRMTGERKQRRSSAR